MTIVVLVVFPTNLSAPEEVEDVLDGLVGAVQGSLHSRLNMKLEYLGLILCILTFLASIIVPLESQGLCLF